MRRSLPGFPGVSGNSFRVIFLNVCIRYNTLPVLVPVYVMFVDDNVTLKNDVESHTGLSVVSAVLRFVCVARGAGNEISSFEPCDGSRSMKRGKERTQSMNNATIRQ